MNLFERIISFKYFNLNIPLKLKGIVFFKYVVTFST